MNKTNIQAVLFDLDDTLWAIEPVLHLAENQLYDWMRQHAPGVVQRETIESLRARRMLLAKSDPKYKINLWALRHAALTTVLAEHGEDPALADPAMEIFTTGRNAVTPFDDVVPGLVQLKSRVRLGTVSNGFADLGRIGLAEHFEISIAAHQFGTAKPDPTIFHAACTALDVSPEQAIYVGDDLTLDVLGAQQAGLRAVWMNRFKRELPDHVRPDAVCTNLTELANWLAA
ncbi:hydrolase [Herbaspirillum sp. meg3]|uniref:HAD family hydrolase n=1 Tax=Herbaspirillum sp. meg3 TaxID=2025949 RepID=UPI000B99C2A9|nr:HAD family hydrolase [Herbaspirillum sp. meg3]ASU40423.1 hydrolase [Herbaspirillum sp. meg3]